MIIQNVTSLKAIFMEDKTAINRSGHIFEVRNFD